MTEEAYIVRLRGLPFSATEQDIIKFFDDCTVKNDVEGVHITHGRDGRVTGEAYVEFLSQEDYNAALDHHNQNIGQRYIEVFESDLKELMWMTGRQNTPTVDFVVRLRGLPYDVDRSEIAKFFNGIRIASNGIGLLLDSTGRSTGEAYVQFVDAESAERARARHMEKMGHRYIEIFKSNMLEANNAIKRQLEVNNSSGRGAAPYTAPYTAPYNEGPIYPGGFQMERGGGGRSGPDRGFYGAAFNNRPGPYNRPAVGGPSGSMRGRGNVKGFGPKSGKPVGSDHLSATGHSVHMRGLPFIATEDDILEFFAPLQPANVKIELNPGGRPTGEADVDFSSHEEAKEALRKDRERIGTRYIELFLNSKPVSANLRTHMRGVRSLMDEDFTEFNTPTHEDVGGYAGRRMDGPMGDVSFAGYGNSRFGGFSSF